MFQTISTTYRSWAFRVTVWLLLAGIMAGLTFMVWVASAVKPTQMQAFQQHNKSDSLDPLILLTSHKPEEMQKLVPAIKFDAVIRDMRNYPKEFKDAKFFKENQGKWTLQVMNVVEHDVITDYLNNRGDREQFNYFRIMDKENQKRYVLTYGVFGNTEQAINTSRQIDFNLPQSVAVFPEHLKSYENLLDEYEIALPVIDKSAKRDVKLQGTSQETPVKPKPKPKPEEQKKPKSDNIEKSANKQETLRVKETRTLLDEAQASKNRESSRNSENKPQTNRNYDENKRQQFNERQNQNNSRQERQEMADEPKPLKVNKAPPPPLENQEKTPRLAENNNRAEKPSVAEREKNREKAKEAFPEIPNPN